MVSTPPLVIELFNNKKITHALNPHNSFIAYYLDHENDSRQKGYDY